jgi:hypothetical protein
LAVALGCGHAAPVLEASAGSNAEVEGRGAAGGPLDVVRAAPDRERHAIAEVARPRVIETRPFDPLALPREVALDAGFVRRVGWATLGAADGGYELWLGRDLLAELEVPLEARPAFRAYAGAAVPSVHHRPVPEPPPCGGARFPGAPTARWAGIDRREMSETSVWFERFEGPFEPGPCRARAAAGFGVRAAALVPGVLYAFRGARADEVVLVAPPAEWVSVTEALEQQAAPHVGTLTLAKLTVKRGTLSSALVVVGPTGMDLFDALRSSRTDTFLTRAAGYRGLSLRTDVVWPASDEPPSAAVVVAGVTHLPDVQLR